MDFDKRLEAAELMWRLLSQSSPVLAHYCHAALNTRCLRLVTEDNQLSRHRHNRETNYCYYCYVWPGIGNREKTPENVCFLQTFVTKSIRHRPQEN